MNLLHAFLFRIAIWLFLSCFPLHGIFSWVCPGWETELWYQDYSTHNFWNKKGEKRPSHNDFHQRQINLYSELYFGENDIVSIWGAYDHITEELNGNTRGFEDVETAYTHRLGEIYGGNFYAQALAIIPAGKEKSSLRYGRLGFEISALWCRDFCLCSRQLECAMQLGYRVYSGFPSDQMRADALGSLQVTERLWLQGCFNLEYGIFNGKRKQHHNIILWNPNYRLLKGQIRLLALLKDWLFLDAGYSRHLWGENVGTGGGFFAGLTLEF